MNKNTPSELVWSFQHPPEERNNSVRFWDSAPFQDIQQYMLKTREERRAHLNLETSCNEIGGNGSIEYKGLLAYFLRTTIPARGVGFKVYLCHACNNPRCSNVLHLYWGTPKNNHLDQVEAGTYKSLTQRTLEKYGEAGVKAIAKRAASAGGKTQKLRNKEQCEQYRAVFEKHDLTKRGWSGRIGQELGMSHRRVMSIAKRLGLLQP